MARKNPKASAKAENSGNKSEEQIAREAGNIETAKAADELRENGEPEPEKAKQYKGTEIERRAKAAEDEAKAADAKRERRAKEIAADAKTADDARAQAAEIKAKAEAKAEAELVAGMTEAGKAEHKAKKDLAVAEAAKVKESEDKAAADNKKTSKAMAEQAKQHADEVEILKSIIDDAILQAMVCAQTAIFKPRFNRTVRQLQNIKEKQLR